MNVHPQALREAWNALGEGVRKYLTDRSAELFAAAPQPPAQPSGELVTRFRTACRALIRERKIYGEDVETMRTVLALLRTWEQHAQPPAPKWDEAEQLARQFDSGRKELPDEWQDWAAEIARDLRALATHQPKGEKWWMT